MASTQGEFDLGTWDGQKAFFESQWPTLRQILEREGPGAVVDAIDTRDDPHEQRVLFALIRLGMAKGDWEGKNLEDYIHVVDAGLERLLEQAHSSGDEAVARARISTANVISANLAADLADCWPEDPLGRTPAHHERGLSAANQCLVWRAELKKGAWPFMFAWWTKGVHELGLGRLEPARDSFSTSLKYARRVAAEGGNPTEVVEDGDIGVLIGEGYVRLASWALGDEAAASAYTEVVDVLKTWLGQEKRRSDAAHALGQLEKTRERLDLGA